MLTEKIKTSYMSLIYLELNRIEIDWPKSTTATSLTQFDDTLSCDLLTVHNNDYLCKLIYDYPFDYLINCA